MAYICRFFPLLWLLSLSPDVVDKFDSGTQSIQLHAVTGVSPSDALSSII